MREDKIRPYRSRAYERFYEGFDERPVLGPDGKPRLERAYVGNYYRRKCPAGTLRRHKLCCAGWYLLSLCLYLHGAFQDCIYNSLPLSGLLEGASLVAWIAFLYPLGYHLLAPARMIERVYRDASKRYRQVSLGAAVCAALTAAAVLGQILCWRVQVGRGLLLCLEWALAALVMYGLYRQEARAEYEIGSQP